jgi:AcrR family transcriptional regulator
VIVNKIGRPSKSAERRAGILLAAAEVVARDGLAETTVAKIADAAGLQRTLVLHYFGDRASLIAAFIDQAVAIYGDTQILGDQTQTIEERLDRAFEPGHYAEPGDLVIWAELVALAARDGSVRHRLWSLWRDRWLPMIEHELRLARPLATAAQTGTAAYGIACLVEAHWSLYLQGLDSPQHRRHAQASARLLLGSLPR